MFRKYNRHSFWKKTNHFKPSFFNSCINSSNYSLLSHYSQDIKTFSDPFCARNSVDELQEWVYEHIQQSKNSLIILMTPSRRVNQKYHRFIQPGHIHSCCTNQDGSIIDLGDFSFSCSTTADKVECVELVPDKRLNGYQRSKTNMVKGYFSQTNEEIIKWANCALTYPGYPLHLFAIQFNQMNDDFAVESYVNYVKKIKNEFEDSTYIIHPYFNPATGEICAERNCTTFIRKLSAQFMNCPLHLGDNPSTQTVFCEFIKQHSQQQINQEIFLNEDKELLPKYFFDKEHIYTPRSFGVI